MKSCIFWKAVSVSFLSAVLLAGCSGSPSQVNPASPSFMPSQSQIVTGAAHASPQDGSQCNNGPLQVSPCYVFVGRGYGRYAQVMVHYPGGDQLREHNNCRRGGFRFHFGRDIARVRGAGQNWTVISGDQRGYCHATFTDINKGVSIQVQIHNARGHRR